MNKLTKAAIAGAAGIALLLGGAGSLAYWNSSTALSGGVVSSGSLTIASNGSPTNLLYSFNGATATAFDPTVNKIVPGDTVTMKQPLIITAVGTHLKADLAIDKTALVGSPALVTATTIVVTAFNALDVAVPISGMTATQAASITYVKVSIAFDNATAGTTAQTESITLGQLNVTLKQIP